MTPKRKKAVPRIVRVVIDKDDVIMVFHSIDFSKGTYRVVDDA